ncbi:MAG TPA: threonine synthase [Acidimicrobiia bacterium]|nr:threonine synthase [Acidimicrobiia bacterium]
MRYVSTRGAAPVLGFDDVLLEGLATDGGLYVPEAWPRFELPANGDYAAVAEAVIRPFVAGSVIEADLGRMLRDTYARFRHPDVAPLWEVTGGHHLLELFWGPTLSFKDYALQFVGAAFDSVLSARGGSVTVLGATSGDTGSAAIEALRDRPSTRVVILFPRGRVSDVQRLQMTTVDATNVHAVAVDGTFDDCQALVKAAFSTPELRSRHRLAAVNSINWGRVMAQAVYYAWTGMKIGSPFDVAVPTGNFGNVLAAEVARRGGVPVQRLVVGTNANHGLVDLIEHGRVVTSEVVPTIAPAMDIQVPSNFERYLFELVDRNGGEVAEAMDMLRRQGALVMSEAAHARLSERFTGHWYEHGEIEAAIAGFFRDTGGAIDPHTAIGWLAGTAEQGSRPMVSVATAHPAKFPEAVARATGVTPALPDDLVDLADRPERAARIPADLAAVARFLDELPGG